jgi:hypothetical protein
MDCIYNMERACSADTIKMSRTHRETYCDTFTKDSPIAAAEKDRLLAEAGSELGAGDDAPRIICTVSECAYNKSFHCKAGGVEIDDPHDSVICNCITYRPK